MATHYRRTIREAVKTLLANGVIYNSVALPIYLTRLIAIFEVQLPGICLYFLNDPANEEGTHPRIYKRDGDFKIEIIIGEVNLKNNQGQYISSEVKTIEDLLDFYAYQVEALMEKDTCLGLVPVMDTRLTNTAFSYKEEGNKIFASCILSYEIRYITEAWDDSSLVDFKKEKSAFDIDRDGAAEMNSETVIQP